MIGILIVSHGPLARATKETVEMIYGPTHDLWAMGLEEGEHPDVLKGKIAEHVEMMKNTGCLILSDLLGGTPTNVTAEVLFKDDVAVISGFNLPMVLTLMARRTEISTLEELILVAEEAGHKGIVDLKRRLQLKNSGTGEGL